MAKLVLYIFVALLAASLIMGAAQDKRNCGRHGDPVSIHILACFTFLIKLFFPQLSILKNAHDSN